MRTEELLTEWNSRIMLYESNKNDLDTREPKKTRRTFKASHYLATRPWRIESYKYVNQLSRIPVKPLHRSRSE